ncbi:MAG: 50S ribosomal protein L21 [Candidatus Zixiibacteriota bacterium]
MYAVFQVGGFQFSGEEGALLKIPRRNEKTGDKVDIPEVLLVKNNDKVLIGTPFVEGARIEAEVMGAGKNDKVLIYKYKRRTKYRRTQGHRQDFTKIKINKIITPGD